MWTLKKITVKNAKVTYTTRVFELLYIVRLNKLLFIGNLIENISLREF